MMEGAHALRAHIKNRYGFLYARYESNHYYFELINLAKMFTFIVLKTFMHINKELQAPEFGILEHSKARILTLVVLCGMEEVSLCRSV